ncbi:MAG: hybrid sensor histidine kinase/response regulator [Phototrophicaceae bacterium]
MYTILVIDDSQQILDDIAELLELENYRVIVAHDGKQGLNQVSAHNPDLVLCDVTMPNMDGYQVLESLRANPETIMLPFIFLTARSSYADMRSGMKLGADDYLLKPFTPDELLKTVESRLKRLATDRERAQQQLAELRHNIIVALPHELRTPLNSILGFSEFLIHHADVSSVDQIREVANYIYDAGKRLLSLTEKYVLYMNVELLLTDAERLFELQNSVFDDPIAILTNTAQSLAYTYQRQADLKFSLPNDCGAVAMDAHNLEIITREVIENAFKFSEVGQTVWVKIVELEQTVEVIVRDDGVGMSDVSIEQIGAYMQFDRKVLEQQGVGLGLAIVKRLVELHNGSLAFKSQLNEYTEVCISLPRPVSH